MGISTSYMPREWIVVTSLCLLHGDYAVFVHDYYINSEKHQITSTKTVKELKNSGCVCFEITMNNNEYYKIPSIKYNDSYDLMWSNHGRLFIMVYDKNVIARYDDGWIICMKTIDNENFMFYFTEKNANMRTKCDKIVGGHNCCIMHNIDF